MFFLAKVVYDLNQNIMIDILWGDNTLFFIILHAKSGKHENNPAL